MLPPLSTKYPSHHSNSCVCTKGSSIFKSRQAGRVYGKRMVAVRLCFICLVSTSYHDNHQQDTVPIEHPLGRVVLFQFLSKMPCGNGISSRVP